MVPSCLIINTNQSVDYDNMVANVYRQLGAINDVTLGTYTP